MSDWEVTGLGFNRDPTHLRKLVYACFASEPTVSGRSYAAERHLRFVVYCRAIDVADARAYLASDPQSPGGIACEHRCGQSVLAIVGKSDRVRFIPRVNDAHNGTETFL